MDYEIYQLKPRVDQQKYLGIDMRDFVQRMDLKDNYIDFNDFELIKSGKFETDFADAQKVSDNGYGQLKYDIDRLDVIHTWWNKRYETLPRDWKGELTASYEYIVQLNGHYYLRHYMHYQKKCWSQIDHILLNKSQHTKPKQELTQEEKQEEKKAIKITTVIIVITAILAAIICGSIFGIKELKETYNKKHHIGEFACPHCSSIKTEGFTVSWTNDGNIAKNESEAEYTYIKCRSCGYNWRYYLK